MNSKELIQHYLEVRRLTEALCSPLETEDYVVQSADYTSPAKWHLAHTTWFFDRFVIRNGSTGGDRNFFPPEYDLLFNSYYRTVGPFVPQKARGRLSRPSVKEVYGYRAHVDDKIGVLLQKGETGAAESAQHRIELGLHHEQQHQELLLMDIKHLFFTHPQKPNYRKKRTTGPQRNGETPPLKWTGHPGGLQAVGATSATFSYDNEQPRHKIFVDPFEIANRCVTNGDYLHFIESGGYADPRLWLEDGWSWIEKNRISHPLYWSLRDGAWTTFTLFGESSLEPGEPVIHLSYYEADAYARWAEARLPKEEEWEVIAAEKLDDLPKSNFLETERFHPAPVSDEVPFFGEAWTWTASMHSPYPGFEPFPGALTEYNGKFMANQMVLRGGSCATPRSHFRPTYRNYSFCYDRWPFTGLRLVRDIPKN